MVTNYAEKFDQWEAWQQAYRLDVLRSADGSVQGRNQDMFDQVRATWAMSDEFVGQAETN